MTFPDIDDVLLDIGRNHEQRVAVAADVESFALTHGIELSTLVTAEDCTVWIGLVAGLPDMVLAGLVCLGLKRETVSYRG